MMFSVSAVVVALIGTLVAVSGANGAIFYQLTCEDSGCNDGCSSVTLPQNECLRMSQQQSGAAFCDYNLNALVIKQFVLSENCTGAYETVSNTLDQCYATVSGQFVEYVCPPPRDDGRHHRRHRDGGEEQESRRHHHRGGGLSALPPPAI